MILLSGLGAQRQVATGSGLSSPRLAGNATCGQGHHKREQPAGFFGVSEFLTGAMNRGGKVRDTRRAGTAQQREVNEP